MNNNFLNNCDHGSIGGGRIGQTFRPCKLGLIDSISLNFTYGIGEYNIYLGKAIGGLVAGPPISSLSIKTEDLNKIKKFKIEPPFELASFDLHELQIVNTNERAFFFIQCTFDDYINGTRTSDGIASALSDLAFDFSFLDDRNVIPTLTAWGVVVFSILILITGVLSIKHRGLVQRHRQIDSY